MALCKQCGINNAISKFNKSLGLFETLDLCVDCDEENEKWFRFRDKKIMEGHTPHCANRQFWGDGECECKDHNDPM